ncbi:MAG TPA: hypothetical protein VGO67_05485 [Verrucomicrobiae bacterium]|jgi:hypothetical protein
MKTLFSEMPGRTAMLVTEQSGKRHRTVKRFKDGCAALRWCERHGATLVYFRRARPATELTRGIYYTRKPVVALATVFLMIQQDFPHSAARAA